MMQLMKQRGTRQRFKTRAKDGKRSAQFMRRVGGKFPLYPEAALEPVKRLVDGLDQWANFARDIGSRNANIGAHRPDVLGVLRSLDQRPDGTAEDDNIGGQQQQQDRKRDPAHAQEE